MNVITRSGVQLVRLGRMRYEPALKAQQSFVKRIQGGEDSNFLLLVEHEPGKAGINLRFDSDFESYFIKCP